LFRYIWKRTTNQFRSEASQYFQLRSICQEHKTDLLALILWFGDKEVPLDLDASKVTTSYLRAALDSLERKLTSRTGGLLEIVPADKRHLSAKGVLEHVPLDLLHARVEYMHRTARDWVMDNWVSITSATSPQFQPSDLVRQGPSTENNPYHPREHKWHKSPWHLSRSQRSHKFQSFLPVRLGCPG
jgi:hypothetical protein